MSPCPRLEKFLRSWHHTSGENQRANGKAFDLSFEEFLALWSKSQMATLQRRHDNGSLYVWLAPGNSYAYVLSWTTYAESQGPRMHAGNAQICARWKSAQDCRMGKDDKHTLQARRKISVAMSGVEKSPEHRANLSTAMMGRNKGRVGTAEESEKKAVAQKARWDRYRAAKAAAKAAGL